MRIASLIDIAQRICRTCSNTREVAATQGKSAQSLQACSRASMQGVPAADPLSGPATCNAAYGQASMHLPHFMQRAMKSASDCMPGGLSSSDDDPATTEPAASAATSTAAMPAMYLPAPTRSTLRIYELRNCSSFQDMYCVSRFLASSYVSQPLGD